MNERGARVGPPVVLVTGAARRIGACIARTFHSRGFRVLIHCHRSVDAARELAFGFNASGADAREDSARVVVADLCDRDAVTALAAQVLAAFSRLDVLVNNASTFYPTPFGESTGQQWDDLMGSNLRGAWFLSQALGEELRRRRGAVVNVVDIWAQKPLRHHPLYSIAKAGLEAMTRSLALEMAPEVRVNGVAPGAILWPDSLADGSDPKVMRKRARILQSVALGAPGKPEDVAEAVSFLAQEAGYVTGQVLRVDGGRHLTP